MVAIENNCTFSLLLLGHNCADPAATRKSYELISRYVMPAVNGDNRARCRISSE